MARGSLRLIVGSFVCALWVTTVSQAQDQRPEYPPTLPGATVETYKQVDGVDLKLWIFSPEGHVQTDSRPAIVFFFGGGWRGGSPGQFAHQCEYLASRGMVAIAADYRVANRHGTKVFQCIEDAKSAVRWIRSNARRLGINPERIAAGGGSAGGHLAAATATVPEHNAASDDLEISAVPDALVLFNPVVVLAPVEGRDPPSEEVIARMRARAGADLETVSPFHNLNPGAPPTIIFHGKADTTVAFDTVVAYCDKAKQQGNSCQVVGYDGAPHGFFNYGRGDGSAYRDTIRRADEFLASLGFLSGPPTIGAGS
jgi:acetyl esterase/lipase